MGGAFRRRGFKGRGLLGPLPLTSIVLSRDPTLLRRPRLPGGGEQQLGGAAVGGDPLGFPPPSNPNVRPPSRDFSCPPGHPSFPLRVPRCPPGTLVPPQGTPTPPRDPNRPPGHPNCPPETRNPPRRPLNTFPGDLKQPPGDPNCPPRGPQHPPKRPLNTHPGDPKQHPGDINTPQRPQLPPRNLSPPYLCPCRPPPRHPKCLPGYPQKPSQGDPNPPPPTRAPHPGWG